MTINEEKNRVHGSNTETKRVTVTPEMCKEWLKKNTDNRPMSLGKVKRLSGKMKAGGWVFTHQGLGFDVTGRPTDGQHRMAAVIDYGNPVDFLVTTGLDPVAYENTDMAGSTRSAGDLLSRRCPEMKNKNSLASMSRMMMTGIVNGSADISIETVVDFAEWYHKDLLDPIHTDMRRSGVKFLYSSAVTAAFANAARGVDEWPGGHGHREIDVIRLTAMRLSAQEWKGAGDPMQALFKKLMNAALGDANATRRSVTAKLAPKDIYAITVNSLRAELQGKAGTNVHATDIDWGSPGDYGQKARVPKKTGKS